MPHNVDVPVGNVEAEAQQARHVPPPTPPAHSVDRSFRVSPISTHSTLSVPPPGAGLEALSVVLDYRGRLIGQQFIRVGALLKVMCRRNALRAGHGRVHVCPLTIDHFHSMLTRSGNG